MAYCRVIDIEYMLEYEDLVQLTCDRDVNAQGTLSQDIDSTSTNIYLTNSDQFPYAGRIRITNEEIDYTSNINNILSGITRGVNNTIEYEHLSGDDVEEVHTIDTDIIDRAIADADAIIDSYLGNKYNNLPFNQVPNVIRYSSVNITIYNLYSRRLNIPNQVTERYNNSIAFLQRVLDGTLSLDSSVDVSADLKSVIQINTYEDDKFFTIGSLTLGTFGTLDSW